MSEEKEAEITREALLELREIVFSYEMRGGRRLQVFDGLSLKVRYAEFLGIAGPSGCGKSTLIRIMAGLLKPEKGVVLFRGKPLKKPTPRIGVMFQNPALFPWYTVLENVLLALIHEKELSGEEKGLPRHGGADGVRDGLSCGAQ